MSPVQHSSNKITHADIKSIPKAPVPPDGGYGWVIVAATFMCTTIIHGISYSFGILLVFFVDYYQAQKEKVAWIGSLLFGITFFIGPLASALVNRFGCRPVSIVGGLISSAAFLLSTIAPNMQLLTFTYGILGGIGFGFIGLASLVSVNYYFSTKRALAVGIALSGSSMGSFMVPLLMNFLLEIYDWKGALMIISGLILNTAVFSALLKPLSIRGRNSSFHVVSPLQVLSGRCDSVAFSKEGSGRLGPFWEEVADMKTEFPIQKSSKAKEIACNICTISELNSQFPNKITDDIWSGEIPSTLEFFHQESSLTLGLQKCKKRMSIQLKGKRQCSSLENLKMDSTNGKTKVCSNKRYVQRRFTMPVIPLSSKILCRSGQSGFVSFHNEEAHTGKPGCVQSSAKRKNRNHYADALSNVSNISELRESKTKHSVETLPHILRKKFTDESIITEFRRCIKPSSRCFNILKSTKDTVKDILDFSLLKEIKFLVTCMAYTFGMMGYYIPVVFLPHMSITKGIDHGRAAFLISALGIASLFSRLVVGFIAEKLKMSALNLSNLCVCVSGGACFILPFCFNYSSLLSMSIIYGFFTAPYICLYSIVLVEIFGVEKLSSSLGILSMFRGIGYMFGSPIAGAIFDWTNRHDISFYVAGTFLVISSSLTVFVSLVIHQQKKMLQEVSK